MSLNHEVKLAIHQQFFKSFADMPKGIQKKCFDFLKKFRENPTSSAINLESIHTFKDPLLKTARVDQSYRMILRAPETGNTYLILWVDQKLKAMEWAQNKIISVNEHNQAIELMDLSILEDNVSKLSHSTTNQRIFEDFSDQQLIDLGISAPILTVIRLLDSDKSFASVQPLIPRSIFRYLSLLKEGNSYEDIFALVQDDHPQQQVETSPHEIDEIIQLSHNQENFFIVTDDNELNQILNAPFEQWCIFLHSSQREIVESSVKGSVRVLGGAGTGKTVVAMHRVKWLIENILEGDQKVLFTTFTKTLTADLRANLSLLLTPEQFQHVEVMHLDQLLKHLLEEYTQFNVAYWNIRGSNPNSLKIKEMWDDSLTKKPAILTPEFMRMEWEQVILAQGISDQKTYLKAIRKGRGTQLSIKLRQQVWACFEKYINSLLSAHLLEPDMAMWEITRRALQGDISFDYRAVVLDEIQDMSTAALRMFRVLTPKNTNDLFLVGDGHQKIYSRPLSISSAGIMIQGKGHAYRLRINYRTTEEIHKSAMGVIQNQNLLDLDGSINGLHLYQSLTYGEYPTICQSINQQERDEALRTWLMNAIQDARELLASDTSTKSHYESTIRELCIVVRSNHERAVFKRKLDDWGIQSSIIESDTELKAELPGVRIMTAHRIKGLEYKGVALVDWSPNYEPPVQDLSGDPEYTAQLKREERSLAYVAMSRARINLFVSYRG